MDTLIKFWAFEVYEDNCKCDENLWELNKLSPEFYCLTCCLSFPILIKGDNWYEAHLFSFLA
jgi:hypothetical protein